MFSNGYVVWAVRREYNRDRLRETERYRLVKQARLAHGWHQRYVCRALSWFGQYLVHWGSHLQQRYTALSDQSLMGATNHNR
jgi:hypothetical protein